MINNIGLNINSKVGFKSDPLPYTDVKAQNLKVGQKVAWPHADLDPYGRAINKRTLVGPIEAISPNTYYEHKVGDRVPGGKNVTVVDPRGGVTIFTGVPPYAPFKVVQ